MRKYHTHKIRKLLIDGFDDQTLRDLCYDEFRPVYQKLSSNTGKTEIIGKLIEYAEAMSQFDNLLNWAKEKNYAGYSKYQPYFEDTEDPYSDKAEEYFVKGTKAMLQGDYGEARRYFSMVLNVDPYYPRARELFEEAERLYHKHLVYKEASVEPIYIKLKNLLSNQAWGGISGIVTILAFGVAVLALCWSVYTFVIQTPKSTPTPTIVVNTPTLAATSTEESTATPTPLSTPTPLPETGTPPVPPTANYSGNLAIPLIFGLNSKVYLTGFDGQGINGPNPVSLDAQQPMFSQDGHSIMVKAIINGVIGLYKLTASGFTPETVVKRSGAEWPVLSPDGEIIMFSESTLDYRLHKRIPSGSIGSSIDEGSIDEVFLNNFPIPAKNLLWSNDNRLVFQGCAVWKNASSECGTWITLANNLDPQRIIETLDAYPMSVRAGSLAYMSKEDGDWEIYLMPLAGGPAVKLTDNDFEDGLPVIAPDGNGIAYISNESGAWGLWTMGQDGQNKKHWFDIDPGRGTIDTNQWSEERMSWRR